MPIRGSRRASVVPITAPSFPTPPRPHVYRKIAYTFIAFTVVIVLAVLWLSSARAEITVKAKRDTVSLDGIAEVAKTPIAGQIPGRVVQGVYEKIQEFAVNDTTASTTTSSGTTTLSAPTTAPSVSAPNQQLVAKGTVRIINKYSRSQTLVKTTRLLTADGKLYRIDKTVTVASNQEVSVGVYADQPGVEYAIGPTRFTIPGLWIDLQKFIYAQSDEAFVAVPSTAPAPKPVTPTAVTPTVKTGKIVTQANIDDAQKMLADAVLEQAKKALAADITDPKLTEVVYIVKMLEQKSNVSSGQAADKFLASVKVDVTAVYYAKEDMLALVRSKLKEKIPAGREFLPLNADAVTYTLKSADAKTETASIQVKADATYRLTENSPSLQKDQFAGKAKADVIAAIQAIDGVDSVNVTITPGWMSKIPTLKDRITLTVQ